MKDYSHLEGKVIKYKFEGKFLCNGVIALIDRDIGITVVELENKDKYLLCYIMPSSPKWLKEWDNEIEDAHKEFDKLCKILETGEYNAIPQSLDELLGTEVTAEDCPFL